ncbi:MAG: histidine phosphatase family protein [Bacteroidales bacterium]|nr:histidine phosphatase family protein [Bacteroidales bacterium]
MLTLVLVRHGEAEFTYGDDFSRKLTSRGRKQASDVGLLLKGWGVEPEFAIVSDARRARETSAIIIEQLPKPEKETYEHFLYEAYTTQELLDCIGKNAEGAECAMVVAHNPDITYKASNLCEDALPCSFPTAGVLILRFECDSWDEVSARSGKVVCASFL